MSETKIIVLDDDPTGSQTVHGCLLLTRWDVATLREAILDDSPLFFVLTNTRGMDAAAAANLTGVDIEVRKVIWNQNGRGKSILDAFFTALA